MTVGFGMSIGSANSVWAATTGDRDRPAVRVRRTAVGIDRTGAVRFGGTPRFAPAITDFADLTKFLEPVVMGGRAWTQADLVAAVVASLVGATDPHAAPVLTHPACYSARQLTALQFAVHRAGMFDVILMPEPVAAVEWLDAESGDPATGSTLVYDLGANSLDVAVVRTEAEWDRRGTVGPGIRSGSYGGRPLGAILARYARALAPDVPVPVSKVVPAEDTRRLRSWHVRTSLRVVRECLKGARVGIGDIDRILVVGGAARPAEVAEVLAELGPPVVMAPDPAHTVATGAAIASARFAAGTGDSGRYVRVAAAASSAAVVSALAMSAATMIGGGPIGTDGPIMEFGPALAGPAQTLREQIDAPSLGPGFATLAVRADSLLGRSLPVLRAYSGAAQGLSHAVIGPTDALPRALGAETPCEPPRAGTYSDPARFTNPLPFSSSGAAAALAAGNAARPLPGTWLPGWDQGQTKPPRGGGGDISNPGAPGHPGGNTPPPADPAPAPIDAPVATDPGAPASVSDGHTADTDGGGSSEHSGQSGTESGAGAESAPSRTDSAHGTSSDDSGAQPQGGATHTGDSPGQDSGAHSAPAQDAAGQGADSSDSGGVPVPSPGTASPDDPVNSAGTANSGDRSGGGEPNSGVLSNAGTSPNSGGAAPSGPAHSGGESASTGTAPGTATGPGAVPRPVAPAVPAPVHPGVVAPARPGGLGTGVVPGGGLGSVPGGFHGGGFGGFH